MFKFSMKFGLRPLQRPVLRKALKPALIGNVMKYEYATVHHGMMPSLHKQSKNPHDPRFNRKEFEFFIPRMIDTFTSKQHVTVEDYVTSYRLIEGHFELMDLAITELTKYNNDLSPSDQAYYNNIIAEHGQFRSRVMIMRSKMEVMASANPMIAEGLKKREWRTALDEYLAFRVSALTAIVCFPLTVTTIQKQKGLD